MLKISVVQGDIQTQACDLLLLKHANGYHGVDELIAGLVGFTGYLAESEHRMLKGRNLEALNVLFVGVGPLADFRYGKIRKFAADALVLANDLVPSARVVCSPVHGPGYGLDERECFLSLIAGVMDAAEERTLPPDLQRFDIVELNPRRFDRLRSILEETTGKGILEYRRSRARPSVTRSQHDALESFGADSESKPKLFVAMPFADDYSDVFDVGIRDSALKADILVERISEESYVGGHFLTNQGSNWSKQRPPCRLGRVKCQCIS